MAVHFTQINRYETGDKVSQPMLDMIRTLVIALSVVPHR